jgi:hypothetical protein
VSPVARNQGHAGRALLIAVGGLVLTLGVAYLLSVLENRGSVEVKLGDDTFSGLSASNMADVIAEEGPFIIADASAGGRRDIVLQHLGQSQDQGWYAIAARPPGKPRNCTIQWNADREVFRLLDQHHRVAGPCDGRTFLADGHGLETFPVKVRDGKLDIDINAADRASTTTSR